MLARRLASHARRAGRHTGTSAHVPSRTPTTMASVTMQGLRRRYGTHAVLRGPSSRSSLPNNGSMFMRAQHMHSLLHHRPTLSPTFRMNGLHTRTPIQLPVRPASFSAAPKLAFRILGRLPVIFAGGTAAGGVYVINKVDNARNQLYEYLDEVSSTVKSVAGRAGEAFGDASGRIGEGVSEAGDFGKSLWGRLRASVEDLFEGTGSTSEGGGNGNTSSGAGGPSGPTPDRIASGAALASSLPLVLDDDRARGGDPTDEATNDLMVLTKKLIEIRSILLTIDHGEGLQLPAIVTIGSQSSGKSSVLEAIVGREFLPKGNNMVTRRPIELTLVHTPPTPQDPNPPTYAEFPTFAPGQRISDFNIVQKTLLDLNLSIPADQAVSSVPVELRVHSPNVPDLSLVDLPGYVELSSMDQPDSLKDEIANLCDKYIRGPNIILAVCAADVDLANSPALRASRRVDPLGMRTIGVVTKMDLVEPSQGADILTNKRYPLALGYVGVVCKAVAKHREPRGLLTSRPHETDEGLIVPVRKQEREFFGSHADVFSKEGIQVTTDHLKRRLMHVLEESMANSLHSISNNVAVELEEAKYQFKVQYNDRTVSPESYLAETLDLLKQRLHAFNKAYGKQQVRKLIKSDLDNTAMEVLARAYWDDRTEKGNLEDLAALANKWGDLAKSQRALEAMREIGTRAAEATPGSDDPEIVWRHKLEAATAGLTRSGVGRNTTQLVVDAIRSHSMNTLLTSEPLIHHPSMCERISTFSDSVLRDRYSVTADQVENCIKPYKHEIELDDSGKEWESGRLEAIDLLRKEIELCDGAYDSLKESVGGNRRLKNAMQYIRDLEDRDKKRAEARKAIASQRVIKGDSTDVGSAQSDLLLEDAADPSRPVFNPVLLSKAREAHFLQGRTALLKARINALKSKQCRNYSDKTSESIRIYCPEAFLNVVADKLASTAVMFINIELLAEYFYLFPREIETRLGYEMSRSEILDFARENPRFRKHLDLQERKEKLELVMDKLEALVKLQQERQGTTRLPGQSRTSRRFGLF